MPTGAEYARIPNKRLLSAEDFRDRILGYLRTLMIATNKAQWSVDGVFDTKLTLTGGVNTVTVNGTSIATDGLGHLFDVSQIFSVNSLFENTNAITYYVAFKYAESPKGIIVNPRTGLPEYISTQELIGEMAAPTSVTDNGNGTITFNVNSVTESGVSNAGRTVRVFKVNPSPDALAEVIAIENLVVAYGAPNNTITTVGDLGQSVISTTAADYVVILLGASVKRNTNTESTLGYFHIGTVVGAGSGNTPSTFDITLQRLLKSFDDASQTILTPYLWIDSTNVQDAIEELVDGLLDDGATNPGATRIGVDGTAFASAELGGAAPRFGIGNVADSTLTDPVEVQETLEAIDVSLRRRHTWLVVSDADVDSAPADLRNVVLDSAVDAYGNLFLRKLDAGGTVPYQFNTTPGVFDRGVSIYGEFKNPGDNNEWLRRTRILVGDGVVLAGGKWQRIYLDATPGDGFSLGGTGFRYGLHLEDFGINGGTFSVDSIYDVTDGPFRMTSGTIIPKGEATKAQSSSLQIGKDVSGPSWGIFSGLYLLSPGAGQTTPAPNKGALHITGNLAGMPTAATAAEQSRPLVFRDSIFVQQKTDAPLILIESDHKVVFENCHFYGMIGYVGPDPTIKISSNAVVIFRDCLFFDPEGNVIGATNTDGLFDNCTIVAGVGGGSTVTSPQIIKATPNTTYNQGLTFRNTTVIIGSAAIRTTGSPPSLLEFGSTSTTDISVDGLRVKFISGSALPASPLLKLLGAAGSGGKANYEKIIINCGGLALPSANTTGLVTTETGSAWQKNTFIKNISVFGMVNPTGDVASTIFALNGSLDVENINIRVPSGTAGRLNSYISIGKGNVDIEGIHFDPSSAMRLIKAPIWITTDADAVKGSISRVTRNFDNTWAFGGTDPAAGVILCDGDKWDLSKIRVDMESQGTIKMFVLDGTDNTLRNSVFNSGTTSVALVHCKSGRRRNKVMDNNITWNGTSAEAVLIESDSSLADGNIFLRTAGANEPITNTGDGGVTGSNNILDDVT